MELTGYSRGYIYNLVLEKKLPHRKPGGEKGRLFFFESEVLEFLASKPRGLRMLQTQRRP
jgi:predicted DNA-binding transcriptional regulator AlpA